MEIRRAADALLRSQGAPLSATLNPWSTIRWTTKAQLEYSHCSNRPAQRCLTTTSRRYALQNIPTTTSAASRPANPPTTTETPSSTQSPSKSSQPPSTMADLGASLGWTSGGRGRSAFPMPRATGQFEKGLNGGSSASDLLHNLKLRQDRLRGPGSGIQVDRMMDPMSTHGSDSLSKDFTLDIAEQTMIHKSKREPMKLGPSTGRSVSIGSTGIDPGRGFRLLEQACARNKVKADAAKQRFHERGGLKRKRLGRERWRRKFMEGFKATIARVKQLKNQGW